MEVGASITNALKSMWWELQTAFETAACSGRVDDLDNADADMCYEALSPLSPLSPEDTDPFYEAENDSELGGDAQHPHEADDLHLDAASDDLHSIGLVWHLPDSHDVHDRGRSEDGGREDTPLAAGSEASGDADLTSAAVSVGSALLGGALGAVASVTISPFLAAGLGASLLVASYLASKAVPGVGAGYSASDPGDGCSLTESLLPLEEDAEAAVEGVCEGSGGGGGCAEAAMASAAGWGASAAMGGAVPVSAEAVVEVAEAAAAPWSLPQLSPIRVKPIPKERPALPEEGGAPDNAWCEWWMP
ncbi:hypothetical protein PLESTF_000795400 [Pleodorina starrii]|nr:hypothetical protein PLESTF_000795400 [Pleodorina starrii]